MVVFHNLENLNKKITDNFVVTIGNFDGVHLGHVDLIRQIKIHYAQLKLLVITFRPHPVFVLNKDKVNHLIQSYDDKIDCLKKANVDYILELDFNDDLRSMSAQDFTTEILLKLNGIKAIALGHDFSIGHNGIASKEIVKEIFNNNGLDSFECLPFILNNEVVCSSLIRSKILEGKVEQANYLLGRNYSISGNVIHGKKLGRGIGFPTANIKVDDCIFLPRLGVYKVNIYINNKVFLGVLNIGKNPTVSDDSAIKVECHIIDFNQNIYSQKVKVEFVQFIRDEMRFANIIELKKQIQNDINKCKSDVC